MISCPCCGNLIPADNLTLEIVADRCRLRRPEARILGAVWRGKGMPVPTARIYEVMFAGEEIGRTAAQKYLAFKVALHHLRRRLKDASTGISIQSMGYGQGWRLVLERSPECVNSA